MNLARVFADAARLWRDDRDLWLRMAGFFFFVPMFAVTLFYTPVPLNLPADKVDLNALAQRWLEAFYANAWWTVPLTAWQLYGAAVVLVLVLDPARPPLAAAIRRALRILPGLALVYVGATVLTGFGLSLFVVPGLYLAGRMLLSQPILVAEPRLGPLGALVASVQRSHRRGWLLFFVPASVTLVQFMALSMVGTLGALAGEASSAAVHFVFGAFEATVVAASMLAQALLQAAAYRELGIAKQGI